MLSQKLVWISGYALKNT